MAIYSIKLLIDITQEWEHFQVVAHDVTWNNGGHSSILTDQCECKDSHQGGNA